jgi:hypothetical protein
VSLPAVGPGQSSTPCPGYRWPAPRRPGGPARSGSLAAARRPLHTPGRPQRRGPRPGQRGKRFTRAGRPGLARRGQARAVEAGPRPQEPARPPQGSHPPAARDDPQGATGQGWRSVSNEQQRRLRTEPGTTTRNGMPPSRDYTYRGTGKDTLTPPVVMSAWERDGVDATNGTPIPPRPVPAVPSRLFTPAPAGSGQAGPAPKPARPRKPRKPPAAPKAAAPPQPAPEPEIEAPAAGPAPELPPPPAPAPEAPRRCKKCRYMDDQVGHQVSCGGEP